MIQDANGAWSIDLVLDASSAPFIFKALAYEGSVTSETENVNTPIFTGVSENINGGGEAVILLAETEESRNESLRTLPSLGSVDKTINTDASIDLIFNLQ